MTGTIPGVREAYDASASAWVAGPDRAYDLLAEVLVAASPTSVAGARVLDLGTGTGAAARAARRAGAGPIVGVDLAAGMLRQGTGWDAAVVADVTALPFAAGSFDLVVAGCCLGHLPDPGATLSAARRFAPALVASAFLTGWTHPAKALVEAVAASYGYVPQPWYSRFKTQMEPAVGDPARLRQLAVAAGFRDIEVGVRPVDTNLRTPQALAAWRLGMAHLAPFVVALAPPVRRQLRTECEQALADVPPLAVPLVVLAAR